MSPEHKLSQRRTEYRDVNASFGMCVMNDLLLTHFVKGTGDPNFVEQMTHCVDITLDTVFQMQNELGPLIWPLGNDQLLQESGIKPYAWLGGNTGRSALISMPHMFTPQKIVGHELHRRPIPENTDPLIANAITKLTHSVFDLDIKIFTGDLHDFHHINKLEAALIKTFRLSEDQTAGNGYQGTMLLHGSDYDSEYILTIHHKQLSNGKRVIFIDAQKNRSEDLDEFSIQITTYPDEQSFFSDTRQGPHHSRMQNLGMWIACDTREKSHLLVLPKHEFDDIWNTRNAPETIQDPDYPDITHALIAGLRLTRSIILRGTYIPQFSPYEYISEQTVQLYRKALQKTVDTFRKYPHAIEPFRREEIIRECLVCTFVNPQLFFDLTKTLGIMELIVPAIEKLNIIRSFKKRYLYAPHHLNFSSSLQAIQKKRPDQAGPIQFLHAIHKAHLRSENENLKGLVGAAMLFDPNRFLH